MIKKFILILLLLPFTAYTQAGTAGPINTINSTLTYKGFGESIAHAGTAKYQIYYDNIDGVLDKPIFILDGFDPGDSRKIPDLFNSFNDAITSDNIVSELRDEGYDLIIVNFPTYISSTDNTTEIDGGGDFIQRNAFTVVALLQLINGMTTTTNENVIIGASMGGLIARYALSYMEEENLTHDTRLYISFDSPHKGANIPISIQYLFNYMVNNTISPQTAFQGGLDDLNSAAAKQMLVDHYLAHIGGDGITQTGSNLPKGAPNFRDAFQSELDVMGFPQNVRNVAMINGSGQGTTSGTPGANIINHTFNISPASVGVNLNFTPSATLTNTVTTIDLAIGTFPLASFTADAESPSFTDGVDSAPGGTTNLSSLANGNDPLLNEFVANLNQTAYCFIPTVSSLSLSSTNNWYTLPGNTSPFANTYIPDANEEHVTLTDGNVAFALSEIREENLSSSDFLTEQPIRLISNPVKNSLVLLNTSSHKQAQINIVDIMGKVVFQKNTELQQHTNIPLNLASGLYILSVNTQNTSLLKTKLVVK